MRMDKTNLRGIRLVSLMCILPFILFYSEKSFGTTSDYIVNGFRYTGGSWDKVWNPLKSRWEYIVDEGRLFDKVPSDPDDDVDYFASGENCGDVNHKAGASGWMEHWHVKRSNWPTEGTITTPSITRGENEKNWEVRIIYDGEWGGASHPDGGLDDDGSDKADANNTADFHYNSHGYAFDKDGLSQFKLILGGGSTGAGKVIDEHYDSFTAGSESMDDVIMYLGDHTNYISDDWSMDYCAKELKFKKRSSQVFTFEYDSPGREHNQDFFGDDPDYYKRK